MRALACLLLTLCALRAGAECPQPLRIAFLDKPLPRMLAGEGRDFADPPGLFVDWTQQALRQLGCKAELVRLPQKRLVSDTAAGYNQITFYLAHTPERAAQLVFPERINGEPDPRLALAETHLALFVRADRIDRVQWDGQQLSPSGLRVGVVGGGVEEPMARRAGWRLDLALNHFGSILKLRRGQVDVAVLPALSFTPEALAEAPPLVELQPPLHRIGFYAPVSPELKRRHPQFVRRFWQAACEAARGVRTSPSCTP